MSLLIEISFEDINLNDPEFGQDFWQVCNSTPSFIMVVLDMIMVLKGDMGVWFIFCNHTAI